MSERRWRNFLKRIDDHIYLRQIIEGWHKKAKYEIDVHNRFICLWIAFNAWVTNYMEEENISRFDKKLEFLSNIKQDSTLSEEYEKLLKEKHFKSQVIKLKVKCPVKDMRSRHASKPKPFMNIKNLAQLMLVIYQIRNNLVHGGKSPDPGRDQDLVTLAYEILFPLFTQVMKKIIVQSPS